MIRYGRLIMVTIFVAIMIVLVIGACGLCSAEESATRAKSVVVVNETDTTLTVFFIGENGNRGTEVPPRLAVAMKVNPEWNTLEVKAIAYRPDGSAAGIANHTYYLRSPKETGWWKVAPLDL